MLRFVCLMTVGMITFHSSSSQSISATAKEFVTSLNASQKTITVFPFDSDERYKFAFFPVDDRKGLPLDQMNASQKSLTMKLLSSSLADNTVKKINDIIELENLLKVLEKRAVDDHFRDPGKYHLAIFGEPGEKNIWGWRFEGHHVSFHFSAKDNTLVAGTPGFLGSNPAIVQDGPQKGKEILRDEKLLALNLLKSLTEVQRKKAVVAVEAPNDIITRIERKAMIKDNTGIAFSELNDSQKKQFLNLIQLYVYRYKKDFADRMLKEAQDAGYDKLKFAWAGDAETGVGHPHYYRIVGPTIIIEYDNTQNNANHVHTVVRDLLHDYGGDQLLEHYKKGHQHK